MTTMMLRTTATRFLQPRSVRTFSTCVQYTSHGYPSEVLSKADVKDKSPKSASQLSVEILAAPISSFDLDTIQGKTSLKPSFPAIGGSEGVAVVKNVGSKVKGDFKAGDLVAPLSLGGTWNSGAYNISAEDVYKVPEVSVEVAAVLSGPCTAYRLLSSDFANLSTGDVIIQNDASSIVGQAVVQIASARGLKVICVVKVCPDYDEKVDHLKNLGAYVVCTSDYFATSDYERLVSDLPSPSLGIIGNESDSAQGIASAGKAVVSYGEKVNGSKEFSFTEWMKQNAGTAREEMLNDVIAMVKDEKLRVWVEKFKFSHFNKALDSVLQEKNWLRKVLLSMKE